MSSPTTATSAWGWTSSCRHQTTARRRCCCGKRCSRKSKPRWLNYVFVAHEIDGRSFKELVAATGVSQNTLLSRKRYAVLRLRERLQTVYDDFTNE
jgi:hypothetical protein